MSQSHTPSSCTIAVQYSSSGSIHDTNSSTSVRFAIDSHGFPNHGALHSSISAPLRHRKCAVLVLSEYKLGRLL